ncbi:MAG TPA: DUF1684 domain-containing protein [Pyrinomonadaceae bacterium]|nr:DUF1684 domain-containing protein [Pyrinomonadaceae bacterium]
MAAVASCNRRAPKSQIDAAAYAKEIEAWHQQRWKELNSEDGWLTLVGLFWLKEGPNKCGSDSSLDIVLPKDKAPGLLAAFVVDHGIVSLYTKDQAIKVNGRPASTVWEETRETMIIGPPHIELTTDAEGSPTIVTFGSLSFQIIKRGDKLGLRVKDSQNQDRLNFKGTTFYPTDVKWRIDAQFEPYNPPKAMPITNVLGMENSESSPGAVKFEIDGKPYRLDAISEKNERRLFMIIADQTSGKDTYPAGRYLYLDPPDAAGHLIIDFNKAYSPPCAFTKFATCPLPPRQNRLPVAIEAGEKYQPHDQAASPAQP